MKKVTATYYVNECNTKHAAMEVFMDVFDINLLINTAHHNGNLFWVEDEYSLFVTKVSEGFMRVDILEDV